MADDPAGGAGGVFAAAVAVLFDVVVASARMGHVIYFFVWPVLIAMIPSALHQGVGSFAKAPASDFALYDPGGLATLSGAVYRTVPDARPGTLSMGRQSRMRIDRVDWPGLSISPTLVIGRIVSLFWAVPLLVLAARRFNRFDPAARRAPVVTTSRGWVATRSAWICDAITTSLRALLPARHRDLVCPAAIAPRGVLAALAAEVRLIWRMAGKQGFEPR